MYPDVLCLYVQDTVLVVPQYPYCIEEDSHDVPLEDCWYARPQLFFKCYLRPKNGRDPKNPTYKAAPGTYQYVLVCTGTYINHLLPDDIMRELVFFNTFEELNLPIKGPMEDSGVVKLY